MLGVLHFEVDVRLDDFLKVAFSVLHDDVEGIERVWVLRVKQLNKLHHERVLQLAHQGNLAQYSLAICLILEDVLHSLDCNFLTRAPAAGEGNFAVAACSEQPLTSVVIAHLPVSELVESKIASASPLLPT